MLPHSLEPKVTFRQELIVPHRKITLGYMDAEIKRLADFAARLNEICDEMSVPPKGGNRQTAFAKIMGVSQKGARKWLEGEGFPTMARADQMAQWAGVSIDWLLTGRGEKRPTPSEFDQHTQRIVVMMQNLPEYLKPTAVQQVGLLGKLPKKAGNER